MLNFILSFASSLFDFSLDRRRLRNFTKVVSMLLAILAFDAVLMVKNRIIFGTFIPLIIIILLLRDYWTLKKLLICKKIFNRPICVGGIEELLEDLQLLLIIMFTLIVLNFTIEANTSVFLGLKWKDIHAILVTTFLMYSSILHAEVHRILKQ